MNKIWKKAKEILSRICIVDRFLMIFMLILFSYMIFHLFTGITSSENTNTIDIIARTFLASIFGYFISSNFSKSESPATLQNTIASGIELPAGSSDLQPGSSVKNQIGFETSVVPTTEVLGKISVSEDFSGSNRSCNKFQVIVVSVIGLISLTILLIAQQFQTVTPELTAIISQLRDFVSACIGFLVSCGKNSAG